MERGICKVTLRVRLTMVSRGKPTPRGKKFAMTTAITNPFPGVYKAAYLEELGVTVEEFARDPEAALIRVGQYDACALIQAGLRPLMPAQVRLRQALEKQWEAEGTPVVRLPPPRPILAKHREAQAILIA